MEGPPGISSPPSPPVSQPPRCVVTEQAYFMASPAWMLSNARKPAPNTLPPSRRNGTQNAPRGGTKSIQLDDSDSPNPPRIQHHRTLAHVFYSFSAPVFSSSRYHRGRTLQTRTTSVDGRIIHPIVNTHTFLHVLVRTHTGLRTRSTRKSKAPNIMTSGRSSNLTW